MDRNETKIECIRRQYRVQTADGMIFEVEPMKPLTERVGYRASKEDDEIAKFFSENKVVFIGQKEAKLENDKKEVKKTERPAPKKITLNPMQRLNCMIKMKGEFTREDYQKYMLDKYNIDVSLFMSHNDIEDALKARKLEMVSKKSGRLRKYVVVDTSELDESSYKSLDKRKIQMEVKQ